MIQKPKEKIDTGIKGNSATGDILYVGGVKLNDIIDNLYNILGDYRLYKTNDGVDSAILHPGGYYQKHTSSYYNTNIIEMGSMHDVDTSGGTLIIRLPKGKPGERITFINSNGSLSPTAPARLVPEESDVILGSLASYEYNIPNTQLTLWCTGIVDGIGIWRIKIDNLYGNNHIPIDETYKILGNEKIKIKIGDRKNLNTIKLLYSATSVNGNNCKSFESLLMIDHVNNSVYSNEYSVLMNSENELFTIKYSLEVDGGLYVELATKEEVSVAIKTISILKIGE